MSSIDQRSGVAIIVPVFRKSFLPDEFISLRQLDFFLSEYSRIIIKPEGLSVDLPGFDYVSFPDRFFVDVDAYSKLLLQPSFYETFSHYKYLLIYQLDCLVFSSGLDHWCQQGYDYIGAPLYMIRNQRPRPSRVGNGGLSLRRVQTFLEVLTSPKRPPWKEVISAKLPDLAHLSVVPRIAKRMRVIHETRQGAKWYSRNFSLNEDLFWSDRATLFLPKFNKAPLDVAMRFSFDAFPRENFKLIANQLPFGAHAWAKWDRAFWEPYLCSADG